MPKGRIALNGAIAKPDFVARARTRATARRSQPDPRTSKPYTGTAMECYAYPAASATPFPQLQELDTGERRAAQFQEEEYGHGSGRTPALYIWPEKETIELAASDGELNLSPTFMVFYTDISYRKGRAGVAVVWRDTQYNEGWRSSVYATYTHAEDPEGRERLRGTNDMEIEAVWGALRVAAGLFIHQPSFDRNTPKTVRIWTDSRGCLERLAKRRDFGGESPFSTAYQDYVALIMELSKNMKENGVRVEIHWVKGHKDVPGNRLADKLAGQVAEGKMGDEDTI